jgi:acyl-CoA synthetase (AMP-forming)/AMP-acid ligase II
MDPLIRHLLAAPARGFAVEDSEGRWTAVELIDAVRSIARALRALGAEAGDRIGVIARMSKQVAASLLATRAIGALTCPVDHRDAARPLGRIRPKFVIAPDDRVAIDKSIVLPLETLLARRDGDLPGASSPSGHAWAVSTSGSGGVARAVVLTEQSVDHVTESVHSILGYQATERVLCPLPLHHTYGLSQLWLTLRSGATLVLPRSPLLPADLARWAMGVTVLPTIAPSLRALLSVAAPSQIRLLTLAGQNTDPPDRELFSRKLPNTRFVNFYGLTEASTRVLWLAGEEFLTRPRATGRPIPGVRAWVEPDGELWVDGPNVAAGYLDDPEASAQRFPGGLLRTGDLFAQEGDLLCYQGRADGTFKRFGEKVVPELVEQELRTHPSVEHCLVVAEAGSADDLDCVAWVVRRSGNLTEAGLIRYMRGRLAPAMVPTRIRFVSSLPRTASGKLKRKAPQ